MSLCYKFRVINLHLGTLLLVRSRRSLTLCLSLSLFRRHWAMQGQSRTVSVCFAMQRSTP